MTRIQPTFLEENGKAKFVVFNMKDYAAIKKALEDAEDARILDEAKRRGAGKPRIPHSEILVEFGLSRLIGTAQKMSKGKPNLPFAKMKRLPADSRKSTRRKSAPPSTN